MSAEILFSEIIDEDVCVVCAQKGVRSPADHREDGTDQPLCDRHYHEQEREKVEQAAHLLESTDWSVIDGVTQEEAAALVKRLCERGQS
jgi:hypothetical protein